MSRSPRALFRVVALLALLLVVAAACGDDKKETTSGGTTKPAEKAVAIAFVGPLTGDAANLGINIRNGAKIGRRGVQRSQARRQDHAQGVRHPGRSRPGADREGQVHQRRQDPRHRRPGVLGRDQGRAPSRSKTHGLVMISASATNDGAPGRRPEQQGVPPGPARRRRPGRGHRRSTSPRPRSRPRRSPIIHDNSEYGKGLADAPAGLASSRRASSSSTPRPSTRRPGLLGRGERGEGRQPRRRVLRRLLRAGRPPQEAAHRRRRDARRSSAATARSTPASSRPLAQAPTARC